MTKVCVFFGHRLVLDEEKIKAKLQKTVRDLIQKGVDTFWLGGYGEFDALAEQVTLDLKHEFPHIQRVFALAYLPKNKEDYLYMEKLYDFMFYPEGVEVGPKKFAITRRNKYLAEHADIVVAYVTGESGGAYQALKYAQKLNKKIILLQ